LVYSQNRAKIFNIYAGFHNLGCIDRNLHYFFLTNIIFLFRINCDAYYAQCI